MNIFTIRDIENLSGIKAHTIRIWEQRYSFLKPKRTGTNIRYYNNEELKTILNIALLNKYGFKISHINKMKPEDVLAKILELNTAEAQQERTITELIQRMIDLDMTGFDEILNRNILHKGIERTIVQLIYPFLEKIGILWQTGNIYPAHEHLVSNIIRQKLVAGIENTRAIIPADKSFLLFLPEGEHHELGLLFVSYLLKNRGAETIYLGANVPLKDVLFITGIKNPDYIYIHLTSVSSGFNFDRFLAMLSLQIRDTKIVISGPVIHTYNKPLPPNTIFKKNLGEVMEFISSL